MVLKEKLMIGTLAASLATAGADILKMNVSSSGNRTPDPQIAHMEGALEGSDGMDSSYLSPGAPVIDFYSVVGGYQFSTDARPTNSLSTINLKINGDNLSSNPSIAIYTPSFTTNNNAFASKNIYSDVYNVTNGVRANLIRTDDLKQMASTNGNFSLSVSNGYCYDLDVRFVPINSPPSAPALATNTLAETDFSFVLPGSDPDSGQTLTYSIISGPEHGTLEGIVNGGTNNVATYRSANNYFGLDNIGYTVSDGITNAQGFVGITVNPKNRNPVINSLDMVGNTFSVDSLVQPNRTNAFQRTYDLKDWENLDVVFTPYSTNELVGKTFNDTNATNNSGIYRVTSYSPNVP